MVRRSPYTKLIKENEIREDHIKGMGDRLFKGFGCLNSKCKFFIFVPSDDIGEDFEIQCPSCGFPHRSGDETRFYDYKLINKSLNTVIEEGHFTISHDDYIREAESYKFCIICNTLKPIRFFDKHRSRKTGRQGECRLCKGIYNNIKNQTRISDQHREAAQKRRMYLDLAGGSKINSEKVFNRFKSRCFKCGVDLQDPKSANLDHTLPVYYLWPLNTVNATLLCKDHNGEKSGKWPSEYYTAEELKKLSVITGIDYQILSGEPYYNPEAIKKLKDHLIVDGMLTKYAAYFDEIIKLRNRIKYEIDFDFFAISKIISAEFIKKADEIYEATYGND